MHSMPSTSASPARPTMHFDPGAGRLQRPPLLLMFVWLVLLTGPLLPGGLGAQGLGAQDGPAEAYRAWWASELTPADPASERFRSQGSIRELAAFRAESPEMAAEALAFMAEMHREMLAAAIPGQIEVVFEDAEEVRLHVVLEGRDGPLPPGLPSEAAVRMVREPDGWKVDTETFMGTMMSGGSDTSGGREAECPADATLGDPASPHRLVLHGGEADRTVHLAAAYLLRDGDALTLHLPSIGENQLHVEARTGAREPGLHAAVLGGTRWGGGCPALPDALVHEEAPAGELEWHPLGDTGSARVSFTFPEPGSGAPLLSATLDAVPLLDISPGPMGEGSAMVTFDGDEIVPDLGVVLLHEGEARLEIMLEYSHSSGGGSTTISVPEFRGEPGVYVGASWFDSREVTVVRVFEGSRIELEVREVEEDLLPAGELDADVALALGSLKARAVTDRMVVVPALPPVGG
jgi:hypothetical protein